MWGSKHILVLTGLLAPTICTAHPHVFVQAELTIIFDGQIPTAVKVDWIYDDYFSLLLTADLGIDLDGDMVLTAAEEAVLDQAVTEWPADFDGDLEVRQDGAVISLGPKQSHQMSFENGIITESHIRPLTGMVAGPFVIQPFDPYYFVAYDVVGPIRFDGTQDCAGSISRADMDAARAMFAELTGGLAPEDVSAEESFPKIGHAFADSVTISCAF